MLHALVARREKVTVHGWRRTPLLNELELHVARIGERDRDVNVVVAGAAIAEFGDGKLVSVEPRPDAANLDPVLHGGFDVAHDDPYLPKLAEKTAHARVLP